MPLQIWEGFVTGSKDIEDIFTTSDRTMAAVGYPLKDLYSVALIAESAPTTLF
jgi:hypothetical protein